MYQETGIALQYGKCIHFRILLLKYISIAPK